MNSPSLTGLHVLNTRPLLQGQSLNHWIESHGGRAFHYPMIEVQGLSHPQYIHPYPLESMDCAIFISPNAVRYFFTPEIPLAQNH